MASKIEWYLVELERMLKGKISEESLNDLQSETRSHLLKLTDEMTEPDEEKKAIRAFGSPRRLALRYLREGRVLDRGVLVILLVMAAICYVFPVYLFDEEPRATSLGGFQVWFALLGLFFVFSLWFRGFKPIPIIATLAATAFATAFVMSYRFVFIDDTHSSGLFTVTEARRIISSPPPAALSPEVDSEFETGLRAFRSSLPVSAELSRFRTASGYLVPSFPAKFGGKKLVWQVNPSYQGARSHWLGWASRYMADRSWGRERNATLRNLIAAAPKPGPANLWPATRLAFSWAGIAALILLGIHAFTAGLIALLEWNLTGRRRLA